MNILFAGDVFGDVGRRVLAQHLPELIEEYAVSMVIANGENSAGGRGITENHARKFRKYGVDIITGGNHSDAQADVFSSPRHTRYVIRPANSEKITAGSGLAVHQTESGHSVAVINLLGRVFLRGKRPCPFKTADALLAQLDPRICTVIVDFHAEATSEKVCLAHYLDGRVSAVVGTHTHVQTNDARIFPGGCGFITDAGMTGPEFSAIGMEHSPVLDKILTGRAVQFVQSKEGAMFNGVLISVNDETGKTEAIQPVIRRYY
ncbi:MAG: TIGR00282 family metallophosphoesterase [Fibrobacterota bacterium]